MSAGTCTATNEVIVCDDEADIRDFLSIVLKQSGYEPLIAETGSEVDHLVRSRHPRVLLMDIRMPYEDGFEIAERLRRRGENIPIVFITAHDNFFCRIYSPAIGTPGYFTKPLHV